MTTQFFTSLKTPRRLVLLTALVLLAVASLAAFWWPHVTNAATRLTAPDPVTAAWEKARAAGSYYFTSDVMQKTIPVASLVNVGRSSRTDALYLEGQNDLRAQTMELTLWSQGGSAINADSGVSVRTENGKTFTRRSNEPWQESDISVEGFAPQGDFLGYLAAIRDVTARETETLSGITFTRYTFTIDGPAFANYIHAQMTAAMRAKGELPPGMALEPPAFYRDMTGSGELWVGTNGLPVRQILDLRFPEQKEERVEAAITVNFSNYGAEQTGLLTLLRTGQWQGAWLVLPSRLPDLTGLWFGLTLSVAAFLVVRYRRARAVQTAIVSAVIVSQVVGPLLSVTTQSRFFDHYRAKAAAQEEQQAAATSERDLRTAVQTGPAFNPHQNPVETVDSGQWTVDSRQWESAVQSPNHLVTQSPALQVTDPGIDTDRDTLTDFTEVRIGSSEVFSDTDEDGLNDDVEVKGFALGGQTWYTDPDNKDTNRDGMVDLLEWGTDGNGDLRGAPLNTDGDTLPDLFDPDNDNDGVPDRIDSAPFTQGTATFGDGNPLQLTVSNLTPNKPTFVEFQLRPQDPKHLWFAHNVLDWPLDSEGQMRDVDGASFASVLGNTSNGREEHGDMKVVPMLEIRIPADSANLPDQAELTPFNITVNDFTADGATKVAYVPLSLVSDDQTGERVAFSGQMRYLPTGNWATPHSVRLAWVVQVLNDYPCEPTDPEAVAQGCAADGYIHNAPAMLHTYYDNWSLTGLTVREDHGTDMAIVYEDPAVDDNKQENIALVALSLALDSHFLKPHDANNDGQRDLKLSDLPSRFDRDNNPSEAQRLAVPNILQVVTNSYPTSDQAAAFTTMTETVKILDSAFKPVVIVDNAIKPLLFFAQESSLRTVTLDQLAAGEGYASQTGSALTINLAPSADKAQPVTKQAILKWQAYCGASGNSVAWRPCTADEYAEEIEARYATAPALPDDESPNEVAGRMMYTLAYYSALAAGSTAAVEEGGQMLSSRYALAGENDTIVRVRAGLNSVAPVPAMILQCYIHMFVVGNGAETTTPGMIKQTAKTLGKSYNQWKIAFKGSVPDVTTGQLIKVNARDIKLDFDEKVPWHFARYAGVAVAGSAIMAVTYALSLHSDFSTPVRATLGAISAAVGIVVTIYIPAITAIQYHKLKVVLAGKFGTKPPSFAKVVTALNLGTSAMRNVFIVGMLFNVALIWGFYGYSAATNSAGVGSFIEVRAALEAVIATLVAIFFAILSATFIGTIIVGIITLFDTILTLICELGVPELRNAPGLDGACFSITTGAVKGLLYLLYNFEPMIDITRNDLMVTGVLSVTLAEPSKGYVPANRLTLGLPVTTTAVHKDPDPANGVLINPYLWLFSPDNVRSSTFKYSLSQGAPVHQPVDLDQMRAAWQDVREDHKYVLTPMYRGVASTNPAPLSNISLAQGINSTVPFSLTMDFAIPTYECWLMPVPFFPIPIPVPVCRVREMENSNTTPFTVLQYDVLPNTLSEFLALGNKPGGGLGQSWDARLPALVDADGDGLLSAAAQGLDPNDNTWDADSDGLSDRFELERRAVGIGYSPVQRDTDGDGLTDRQEALIGTDPQLADTDNDGLSDGAETRHQVVDANGALTANWAGGWQVTTNGSPALTVWVSSDPFHADGDSDGINDQAEKELAANADPALRVDEQGVPYHPFVRNTPPLAVLTASNAFDGYIGPNQKLFYTTTVVASVPVEPGMLDVTVPASQNFGGPLGAAPLVLPFNTLTFSGSQTVTQAINFTALPIGAQGTIDLLSTARTRLQNNSGAEWVIDPVSPGAPLSGFTPPRSARNSAVAAINPGRPDSYLLNALTMNDNISIGDVRAYNLTTGAGTILSSSDTTYTGRNTEAIDLAGNRHGTNVAVWDQRNYCRTMTINSLKVEQAGADHGTPGIEPFITVVTNNRSASEQVWYWDTAGGAADMTAGQQRGPNAGGFPLTRTICGDTDLQVWESDGPVNIPAQNELVGTNTVDTFGRNFTFTPSFLSAAGHLIKLDVSIGLSSFNEIAGTRLNSAGVVQSALSFPPPAIATNKEIAMFNPVVASNDDGFVVLYQAAIKDTSSRDVPVYLVAQAFDSAGTPTGTSFRQAHTSVFSPNGPTMLYDLAWLGDRYRMVWKQPGARTIQAGDLNAAGAFTGSGWTTLATDAIDETLRRSVPRLAYDPFTTRWLLAYNPFDQTTTTLKLYPNPDATTPVKTTNRLGNHGIGIAYDPQTRGWLLAIYYQPELTVIPLTSDLDLLAFPSKMTVDTQYPLLNPGTSLACPAPVSLPMAELRFEELPTANGQPTTFVDSRGITAAPTCTGDSCPAAGLPGAPNAPGSDYAAGFDGVNDRVIFDSPTPTASTSGKFTYAFWMKAAPGANTNTHIVSMGNIPGSPIWGLGLNGSNLRFSLNSVPYLESSGLSLDNNEWHFVAVAYNGLAGTLTLYADGVQVATRTAGAISDISAKAIGATFFGTNAFKGAVDHFQSYTTALDASAIQGLYNRTLQPSCVASNIGPNAADVRWGKITVHPNDLRGGRLTASGGLKVIVDNTPPVAQITSFTDNAVVGPDQIIGGTANDNGVGVSKVEVSVNNGPWQPAEGLNTWSFSLAGLSGVVSLRVRATDWVGNVGPASPPITVTIDNTAPQVTITAPAGTIKPTQNAAGQWQVPLTGTVTDANGIQAGSITVKLTQNSGVGVAHTMQIANAGWTINYLLDPGLADPTGGYTVTVQAEDTVGNHAAPVTAFIRLDASGPLATLSNQDATRQIITQTLTIGGVISDTGTIPGSTGGIDKLEIAFTPVEAVIALPTNITTAEAEAQLNRQWLPVTLAQRGAGVAQTTWSVAIPADLENTYQLDLRGYDLLGNVRTIPSLWRGAIDTRDPRVVMTATATGATYVNTADNTQRYEMRFVCGVQDRNLNESSFVCPGEGLAEPVRSFDNNPALQALFPDLTLRTGLAISYTLWTTTTTPAATARACDSFGRCAQASAGSASAGAVAGAAVGELVQAAAAPGAPQAVIVNPTSNSFVAAGNGSTTSAISVTVAAEAGAGLKDVTIKLDNATVQTLSFAQSPAITRTVRTVSVPVATEGTHTLVAQATAWDNSSQTTLFPVVFMLDQNAPIVTIDASALTLADTWVAQSGVLRFNGNASDSVGLAAVQIREGNNGFTDASFGGGTWRVALPVADPEGRTLNITVRAIDRAGRITQLNQAIATDLSAADAPDTTISSGPSNPSAVNNAQFVFTGSASAVTFECSLDNGVYTPCASPASYGDLSKGSHTFRVRAIDGRGLPDLTPAEYTWTVNAGQPDATITGKPTNPTTERTATFTFSGDATATRFECSLDGAVYAPCTSPQVYNNLGNGEHTFLVRARNSANAAGAADRYTWTVTNVAPVANSQTVVVIPNQAKSITLTATDNEPLLYTIVTPPAHGVLAGIAPNLRYLPDTGYGGVDSFTFKVSDGLAESNVATVTIFVDNVPPVVTCSVTPNRLWPPNHKLISSQATVTVSDLHSGPAGFTLVSVTSSEADSGLDAADVPNDRQNWVAGTPDVVGQLRAERSDAGNGRTYTLTYEGKDLAGNKALCTTTVTVPKSQGGRTDATYDENQVLPDAYVDAQPAPADPVNAPVSDAPATDTPPTNSEAQTLKLFLPLVTNEAVNQ